MPAWLIAALQLLGGGVGLAAAADIGPFGERGGRRSRRRRALTASDKNDISFMAAVLGEPTARKFALVLASRPR